MKTDRKGPLLLLLAAICWSLGGVCIKFIPFAATTIISLRAVLAVLVFAIYRKSFRVRLSRGNILAALCLSCTTILFVYANKLTTAAAAILLQFTAPVFIILFQFIFYKHKPKLSEILASAFTISGMLLFFGDKLGSGEILGNILAIASGLTFAGVFMFNKRADVEPEQSSMLGFYINAIVFLPFVFFDTSINADLLPWSLIALLGIVQVGLSYLMFSVAIKQTPALLACLITAVEPVLNPLLVALVTPERPGRFALAGGVVIVITVVIYNIWMERNNAKE